MRRLMAGGGFIPFRRGSGGQIPPALAEPRITFALVEIEPVEYVDARTEARSLCRNHVSLPWPLYPFAAALWFWTGAKRLIEDHLPPAPPKETES